MTGSFQSTHLEPCCSTGKSSNSDRRFGQNESILPRLCSFALIDTGEKFRVLGGKQCQDWRPASWKVSSVANKISRLIPSAKKLIISHPRDRFYVISGVYGSCGGPGGQFVAPRIATAVHELGHYLKLPDLYGTPGKSRGIGNWGFMGNMVSAATRSVVFACVKESQPEHSHFRASVRLGRLPKLAEPAQCILAPHAWLGPCRGYHLFTNCQGNLFL